MLKQSNLIEIKGYNLEKLNCGPTAPIMLGVLTDG